MPTVRATRGSFSGPMTTSATTPISAIFSRPRSNTVFGDSGLLTRFDVDRRLVGGRIRGHVAGRWHHRVGARSVFNTVFEALDGTAKIAAHVAQLLGTEHHHHDQQHDQPVPNRKR